MSVPSAVLLGTAFLFYGRSAVWAGSFGRHPGLSDFRVAGMSPSHGCTETLSGSNLSFAPSAFSSGVDLRPTSFGTSDYGSGFYSLIRAQT